MVWLMIKMASGEKAKYSIYSSAGFVLVLDQERPLRDERICCEMSHGGAVWQLKHIRETERNLQPSSAVLDIIIKDVRGVSKDVTACHHYSERTWILHSCPGGRVRNAPGCPPKRTSVRSEVRSSHTPWKMTMDLLQQHYDLKWIVHQKNYLFIIYSTSNLNFNLLQNTKEEKVQR